MIPIPGTNPSLVVIGDTDALIATLHQADANFMRAKATLTGLVQQEAQTIFPVTTIAETVMTLKRKLNQPELAAHIIQRVTKGDLAIADTDITLLHAAMEVFDPAGSKQKTLFDALVVATARKYGTDVIFSFDTWYEKLGFTLASSVVELART